MDPDITMPIAASNILAVMRYPETSNSLLDILSLSYGGLVVVLQQCAVVLSIYRFGLEHVEVVSR